MLDWRCLSIDGGPIRQGASAATILSRQCQPANAATASKPASAHIRTLPVGAGLGARKQFGFQLAAGGLFGFQQRQQARFFLLGLLLPLVGLSQLFLRLPHLVSQGFQQCRTCGAAWGILRHYRALPLW